MTEVIQCNCKSKFQDERYGKDMRVHNKCISKASGTHAWRCTVCSNKVVRNLKTGE